MSTYDETTVRRGPHAVYFVSDERVLVGASHGNAGAWVPLKATGAIQKFFALRAGVEVFDSVTLTYGSPRHRLVVSLPPGERASEEQLGLAGGHVALGQVAPGTFEFHRAYQRHRFRLPGDLNVKETIFVPRTGFEDPAVAYIVIAINNIGESPRELILHAYAELRGKTPPDVVARYDKKLGALIAWNESRPQWTRVFGCTEPPRAYQTMHHAEDSYDSANVPPLRNETQEKGTIVGALAVDIIIAPTERRELAFVLAFSEKGDEDAVRMYRGALDVPGALERTEKFYEDAVARSRVLTPERTINDGAMWSKVNMLRVMARYPQGMAVTNDPGSSSNVVGRDLAWFTIGLVFFDQPAAKEMLLRYAATQYESGKLPEYYNAVTGETEDYGLNINDDTPLFVSSCARYLQMTGDAAFCWQIWPYVEKACEYIMSQRDDRGLVACTATGTGVYGICSWRNIIAQCTVNGAVTELNSLCCMAIKRAAKLARFLAETEEKNRAHYEDTARRYADSAARLGAAINKHLINRQNGMYVLNIGVDGDVHTDVTGDEVFPVMAGVAPPEVAYRIISRLNNPDFQTDAGLRTVSRLSPDYTPYHFAGLLGGVWPGLSFWYAFAAAKIYPDAMVHNLLRGYAHYLRDPKIFNTVPGQFSEWFDGESLINRGMRLSPWEPPRYLWAAIEGACGLSVEEGPEKFSVLPLMPSGWTWLAVRQIPLAGKSVTYFVGRDERFQVFATCELETKGVLEIFDEDISDDIERLDPDMETIGFRRGNEMLFCLGSTSKVAFTFPVTIRRLRNDDNMYTAHIYDSTRRRWVIGESAPGKSFANIALRIDAQGYGLIRLVPS
jgi:glycogen debranching enzyme